LQHSKVAVWQKKHAQNFNEQVRILPKDVVLTTNLSFTPQRVMIQQLTPPVLAIVIENKSVIQMHREMFEIMWSAIPD